MQNFIQKQIIFSVFMSVAAVPSASAAYAMIAPPATTQYARSADSYNAPSPLNSTQNGMSPEQLEQQDELTNRVTHCNSPVDSNTNESEMLNIRALSNSPEWLDALKEDDHNKYADALCMVLSVNQLDNRVQILNDQNLKRTELVDLARAEHSKLYFIEAKINAAAQLLHLQRIQAQGDQKTVAFDSMRSLAEEGLDINSKILKNAKLEKRNILPSQRPL